MFVNCSNHASDLWEEVQKQAAEKWGKIIDYPFPNVSPEADTEEIHVLARQVVEEIMKLHPQAVMCQGEWTLSYEIIRQLKQRGIYVAAACSKRIVTEKQREDGSTEKCSLFRFVQFREY